MAGFKKIEDLAGHPRPDFARRDWTSLDGEWRFALDPLNLGVRERWFRKGKFKKSINVPFCVESEASGLALKRGARRMWYSRRFEAENPAGRLLLHFGAADYRTVVWLNGRLVGEHEGGYTPFSFDLSGYLEKDNLLVARVSDSDDLRIPRGKQTVLGRPMLVHYTQVSGIWQPVWLEKVGAAYLRRLAVDANPGTGRLVVRCALGGDDGGCRVRLTVTAPDGEEQTAEREAAVSAGEGTASGAAALIIDFDTVKTWSPESPALYRLKAEVLTGKKVEDKVESYFGWRAVEICGGRILLNGEPFYQRLLLNQGYFPGGWYSPECPEDFRKDAELIRDMGFNGMRIHQKIEDPRFLFWCDLLGLAVWEEMPSGYLWSKRLRDAIRSQWREAMTRDLNHPCILFWVPFNESWGIHPIIVSGAARKFVREMVKATRGFDPSRPVVDNSGFEHVETDVVDIHHYLKSAETAEEFYDRLRDPDALRFRASNLFRRFSVGDEPVSTLAPTVRYEGQPLIISEYGGFGFYKSGKGKNLLENFSDFTLGIARQPHLQGYAYTQFTDVEQERNGLLELDRTPKVPVEEIRKVNEEAEKIVDSRQNTGKRRKNRAARVSKRARKTTGGKIKKKSV